MTRVDLDSFVQLSKGNCMYSGWAGDLSPIWHLQHKRVRAYHPNPLIFLAGPTRLELATSGVTGRRSNQLNYDPDVYAYRRDRA